MSALPLRLVQDDLTAAHCAECGEKTERIRRLIDTIEDFAEKQRISDETVRKYYNANQTLKAQLKRQDAQESSDVLVSAVFEFWKLVTVHPRAKLGAARTKAIVGRVREGATPRDFFCAVVGAAFDPFTTANGKTFDDLELICRNEAKLEANVEKFFHVPDVSKFIRDAAGDAGAQAATALMDLHRQQVQETARKEANR